MHSWTGKPCSPRHVDSRIVAEGRGSATFARSDGQAKPGRCPRCPAKLAGAAEAREQELVLACDIFARSRIVTTFDNSDTAAGTKDSGALDSRSKTSGSLMSDEHIAKEGSNASDKPDAEPPRLYCCRSETSSHAAPPRFVVGVIGASLMIVQAPWFEVNAFPALTAAGLAQNRKCPACCCVLTQYPQHLLPRPHLAP